MILGRFGNTSGRPYLAAYIVIPGLNVSGSVSFLVDTGADGTVLMPTDSIRLGVDFSRLSNPVTTFGVGGASVDFGTRAVLLVSDNVLYGFEVNLTVMQVRPELMTAPSLM